MRVRDLGPLLIEQGGRAQPVLGTKGPAMLALLTIHANEHVSVDALTAAAWGDHAPAGVASTLLSHIWRLRQLVEPDRRSGRPPQVLLNDAGGYRLVGTPSTIDSLFLAETTARVRDALSAGRLDAALGRADEALSRWRGRPYGRAADADWARPAVARLDELREHLQERRIAVLVALGALDTALSDLRPLLAACPFHETLRALQMEALHRSGRTEQALEAYHEARRTLLDELGIEPGRDLRALHRRILDDDPDLAGPPTTTTAPITARGPGPAEPPDVAPPRPSAGVHLPSTLTPLIGRDADVSRLVRLLKDQQLVTITGPAGSGKTRLALEVARTGAEAYEEGVWFVDLVGVDDPTLVVDVVASTIGFVPSADATPVQDLRRYLTDRRVLVVLDNCEHLLASVASMVQVVLDDPPDGAVARILATSRERLGVAGEVGWTLEPLALPLPGDDPSDHSAVQLFLQRLLAADPGLEVDERTMAAVVDICVALDGLPLPLELAAARAPAFSLTEIASQVRADPGRLRRPGRGGHDHRITLRSTIDRSYQLLTDGERAAHRQLSVLPGPFTQAAAAAVLDTHVDDAGDVLVELVHRSMLTRVGADHPDHPTTFRQLVTVRDHARTSLRTIGMAGQVELRRDHFITELIGRRPPLGTTGEPAWYDALDDDHATVRATLTRRLIESPSASGELLAAPLSFYWYYRGRLVEATRWLTLEHDLRRDGDARDLAVTRLALAAILTLQGRHRQARPHFDAALTARPARGDPRIDPMTEMLVGAMAAAWVTDHHALLLELHRHLRALAEKTDTVHLHLLVDAVDVLALAASEQRESALTQAVQVQHRAAAAGVPMASWLVSGPPLAVSLFSGRPEEGIPWVERCMADHFPSGTGAGGAFIETRANFAAQQRDLRLAARLYGAAHATTRRVGMRWPWRDLTLQLIDVTRDGLPDGEFDDHWRAGQDLTPLGVLDGLRHGWTDRGVASPTDGAR
ncbi:AfsR/SARP family transcriptional regulator [Nakamurella leprariae]|uniref:AAA family ATPase n=1 Tax=Nakamurella leprariae TaxID=2803911 RepID=A0A938YDY3_9ACTN|nr:BTAD domain-containing putative transcriptional regulator [Nakamurella leprariae]MBM9466672.1 AAA family ATPase [Nakamurella leprariae]